MTLERARNTIDAGPLKFSVRYADQDGQRASHVRQPDQGVSIQVLAEVQGEERQLLRFDCFDRTPHYHYDPAGANERVLIDRTTAGNPVAWSLEQLRTRLPEMLDRAGFSEISQRISVADEAARIAEHLERVESTAREAAVTKRRTVTHNGSAQLMEIPGCEVIEAGNIRFGLEFRELPRLRDRGMAIHVLSDVAGQEIELLAFDCFDNNAHYHYGPRNKDFRHYWDRTLVPDPLRWVLDQFKAGKLPAMIEHAGYPSIANEIDTQLVATLVTEQIEPKALSIRQAHAQAA